MDLLQRTKSLLRRYNVHPRKRFGQNFSVEIALLQDLVSYASLSKGDVVLEVGAGLGSLTKLLSPECKRVLAVEVDATLIRILRKELKDFDNVALIEGDIMNTPLPSFNKVVSTPPYSISSPLLFWLLEKNPECAVLTLQEELAGRLVAPVGSSDYGRLTVITYYHAEVEVLDHVPREMFYPKPDVDSRIICLKPRKPPFPVVDETLFFDLVRTLFTQRNKKTRNAVGPFLQKIHVCMKGKELKQLADSLPFHDRRVRRLAPEDFGLLANEIVQNNEKIFFDGYTFVVSNSVYKPAEDTYLVADNLIVETGETVLDMGAGCGILGILAAEKARKVVAVDINPCAVRCTSINAKLNHVASKLDIRQGDLFEPLREDEIFDLILVNPPYLPSKVTNQKEWIERAWSGGTTGRNLIDRFISEAPNHLKKGGRILLVQSSLSEIDETVQKLEKGEFRVIIIAERKVAFEKIVLIMAKRCPTTTRKEV
ncbi:MAG: ribosomal RNA small subunit methyltransferase A [Candidatus Bathyarchaeota archaeon]|nr:MAG: ribosomal RNA small subunit methyltransferase A [Candidatus Bathyarchaeota archaeon]